MLILLSAYLSTLGSMFRSRAALELENLALRHQIGVLKRSARKRPTLTAADRLFWVFLSRVWDDWRSALDIVQPATVIAWHRKGFRLFWTWKIRHGRVGRPTVACKVRELIRRMSRENPLWGAPHIHGELLKLGLKISETSVAKYLVRRRDSPSQTWRTFLDNHCKNLVSVDFFTVPTIRFQALYVFWCWRMTGAGCSTSMSPRILRRNGRHSNCGRHSHLIKSRAICSAITVAAGLRGARDRLHPARVPGSCDRLRRSLLASNPVLLLLLLSSNEAASFLGQRRAGASADPATGAGISGSRAPSWMTASPLRTTRGLKGLGRAQPGIGLGESSPSILRS
jgi:hypothetical protein